MLTRLMDGFADQDLSNVFMHLNNRAGDYHSDVRQLMVAIDELLRAEEIIKEETSEHYSEKEIREDIIRRAKETLEKANKGLRKNLAYYHAANKAVSWQQVYDSRPKETAADRKFWRKELCSHDGRGGFGGDPIERHYYEKFPTANPHNIHINYGDGTE